MISDWVRALIKALIKHGHYDAECVDGLKTTFLMFIQACDVCKD